MLKQNTPYIKVLKMVSSEEIICKVVEDMQETFIVEKPLYIAMGPQGPQFAPFMSMANQDKPIVIEKSNVMGMADPEPGLESTYSEITSNLVLPKKNSIITN